MGTNQIPLPGLSDVLGKDEAVIRALRAKESHISMTDRRQSQRREADRNSLKIEYVVLLCGVIAIVSAIVTRYTDHDVCKVEYVHEKPWQRVR